MGLDDTSMCRAWHYTKCGSGAVAAALVYGALGKVSPNLGFVVFAAGGLYGLRDHMLQACGVRRCLL